MSGNLSINLARQYLAHHEWSLAKKALQQGISKGRLSESDQVDVLFNDICQRLGVANRDIDHTPET